MVTSSAGGRLGASALGCGSGGSAGMEQGPPVLRRFPQAHTELLVPLPSVTTPHWAPHPVFQVWYPSRCLWEGHHPNLGPPSAPAASRRSRSNSQPMVILSGFGCIPPAQCAPSPAAPPQGATAAKSKARRPDLAPLGGGISTTRSPLSPADLIRTPSQIPVISRRSGAVRSEGDR